MVLSLMDICLPSIIESVENGSLTEIHRSVPPKFRQRLLDMVLKSSKIDNPIWIRELSSQKYLAGLSSFDIRSGEETYDIYLSFDTQSGKVDDRNYLNSVSQSIGSISENGESIGSRIEKLKLNLYANLDGVVRLITQCPNLKSLAIKTVGHHPGAADGLLNQLQSIESCRPILENLTELRFTGSNGKFLIADQSIIDFKKLTSLSLSHCSVDDGSWRELLVSVQNTLIHLDLTLVESSAPAPTIRDRIFFGADFPHVDYLPIPLPVLKSLKIDVGTFQCPFRCTKSFVDNLRRCSKLEQVNLSLESYKAGYFNRLFAEDEESLKALPLIEADVTVKIRIYIDDRAGDLWLDGDSKFKLVSVFGDRITRFALDAFPWKPAYTTALGDVVDVCRNLTSLELVWPVPLYDNETLPDSKEVKSVLTRFFGDRERVAKLSELVLWGDFDFDIVSLVSENCSNLDSLEFRDSHQVGDLHLIQLAERGVRLSKLNIIRCRNIGDDGLVCLLIGSGERLKNFEYWLSGNDQQHFTEITDRTWRLLIDHCPSVERISGMPDHLRELASSKYPAIHFG